MVKVGIVGFGNLGKFLLHEFQNKLKSTYEVVFVWNRTLSSLKDLEDQSLILENLADFATRKPQIIIEVAHPSVTEAYGEQFINYCDFFCGSPTALGNDELQKKLLSASHKQGHWIYIPSGALWGAQDIYKMAKQGDLKAMTITMKKHPFSLKLEHPLLHKLIGYVEDSSQAGEFVVYDGNVRELCQLAPNNVNTMACAALAGCNLGFDQVKARLIADKSLEAHVIDIDIVGPKMGMQMESENLGEKTMSFSVKTTRINPAKPGHVTGNATYISFLSSLLEISSQSSRTMTNGNDNLNSKCSGGFYFC
jgi:aspartate dehydrogenase